MTAVRVFLDEVVLYTRPSHIFVEILIERDNVMKKSSIYS